jgi:hypothetical protein
MFHLQTDHLILPVFINRLDGEVGGGRVLPMREAAKSAIRALSKQRLLSIARNHLADGRPQVVTFAFDAMGININEDGIYAMSWKLFSTGHRDIKMTWPNPARSIWVRTSAITASTSLITF